MDAYSLNVYNTLLNRNSGANAGGIWPDLAAGVTVTTGKSYAYGSWAQIAAAASVTSDEWLVGVVIDVFYIATGESYQGRLGLGAAASEVAMTGGVFRIGHQEATAAGELVYPNIPFHGPPLFVPSGSRIAAEAAAASANARSLGVSVLYRTGLGT